MDRILTALDYIPADDYGIWTKVGMALKFEGYSFSIWDEWSRKSSKYPGVESCNRKWNSFRATTSEIVKGGTIMELARQYGYTYAAAYDSNGTFSWDDVLDEAPDRGYQIFDPDFVPERSIQPPPPDDEAWKDLVRYLNLLYQPDDHVGYCDRPELKDGRWVPKVGYMARTQADLLKALQKGIDNASIKGESEGGAFIRFNPLDGEGETDANVTDFRYCLVESDNDSIEKQYALLIKMKLPIICLVHSGNKSLHAIVRVDAGVDGKTFKERTNFIYQFCQKNGLNIDPNVKNASRYSRMPGIKRGDKWQYIVAENLGFSTYEEWRKWVEIENDNLPEDVTLDTILTNLPPLKPELISGVLRVGHKMLISGPSKAGKSFLLMNLAVCFAEGLPWIGCPCKQGRVLYVNLELDESSCFNRFSEIYKRLGIEPKNARNITIWNLRGKAVPMDKLTPFLINRYKGKGYVAIIIDPIYKVITGDENSATDMSIFCGYFDRAAIEIEAAMIYCHHHSKGANTKYSNSMDRSSGSGVFARDPDAILDMVQLNVEPFQEKYRGEVEEAATVLTGWEVSGTLREFPPIDEKRLWFDYPIHREDKWNFLGEAKYTEGKRGIGKTQLEREEIADILENLFFTDTMDVNEALEREYVLEETGLSDSNLKKHTRPNTNFECGTLSDGTKVVFRRGQATIFYRGCLFQRPTKKNQKWTK